jgi:hypothetical protein
VGVCLRVAAENVKGTLVSSATIGDRAEPSVANVLGRLAASAEAFARAYPQRVPAVIPR